MTGQHIGRQSDAIDNEDLSAARSAQARLQRVMKPAGRVFHGISDIGDGDMCQVPGHGKKYRLKGGGQWCPNQSHDAERVRKEAQSAGRPVPEGARADRRGLRRQARRPPQPPR